VSWDPERAAFFFDDYGEREWTCFTGEPGTVSCGQHILAVLRRDP
jgi:hypothetical protein